MGIVPKGAQSNVRSIRSAGHGGGRKDSKSYDPTTGEEQGAKGYVGPTRDSATESDVFSVVETTGYSEHRFYTRSVNADGHGERLQVRVPQGIDSQMHAAVAEIAEYRTLHDLVRDAVIHRLEYLQKRYSLGDGARRTLELARMQADTDRAVSEVREMTASVDDLDAALKAHYDTEDWQMFRNELERGEERVQWLRDPYKTRAEKVLREWKGKARSQLMELAKRDDE